MEYPTLLALEAPQPGRASAGSITKRHTAPQLNLSTSGLPTISATSSSTSGRSPRLSPATAGPNRTYTFPLTDVEERYVRSMEATLQDIDCNRSSLAADILPVPKFIVDKYADEIPTPIDYRNAGEAAGSYEEFMAIDCEPSQDAPSYAQDSTYSAPIGFGKAFNIAYPNFQSHLSSPRALSSPGRRRKLTSDSGIGSSTRSGLHIQSASSVASSHFVQLPGDERTTAAQYGGSETISEQSQGEKVFENPYLGVRLQKSASPSCVIASSAAQSENDSQQMLSPTSTSVMSSVILQPLIKDERFREFRGLCENAMEMLEAGGVRSLRDLEKHVIHTASSIRKPHMHAYSEFCKDFLRRLERSIPYISERDLIRQYDRPYDRGYFLDIHQQLTKQARTINMEENVHPPTSVPVIRDWNNEMNMSMDLTESQHLMRFLQGYEQLPIARQLKRTATDSTGNHDFKPVKKQKLGSPTGTLISDSRSAMFSNPMQERQKPIGSLQYSEDLTGQTTCMPPPRLSQQQMPGHASFRPSHASEVEQVALDFMPDVAPQGNHSSFSPIAGDLGYENCDPKTQAVTMMSHSRRAQQNSVGVSFLPEAKTREEMAKQKMKQTQKSISGQAGKTMQLNTRKTSTNKNKPPPVFEEELHGFACTWPGCTQGFTRMCDLTKHKNTHTRPHKCNVDGCKYEKEGFPTEKERDRHISDKHSTDGPEFSCEYPPCTYKSKRLSNCKQHMEKAHGYQYIRTKSNARGGPNKVSADTSHVQLKPPKPVQPPQKPSMTTPPSSPVEIHTPSAFTEIQEHHAVPVDPQILAFPMEHQHSSPNAQDVIPNYVLSQGPPNVQPFVQTTYDYIPPEVGSWENFLADYTFLDAVNNSENLYCSAEPARASPALRSGHLDPALPVMGSGFDFSGTNLALGADPMNFSGQQALQPNIGIHGSPWLNPSSYTGPGN